MSLLIPFLDVASIFSSSDTSAPSSLNGRNTPRNTSESLSQGILTFKLIVCINFVGASGGVAGGEQGVAG